MGLAATGLMLLFSLSFLASGRALSAPHNAAAELGGTSWQLVKFQGSDDKTLTPDDKAKYTIDFEADGQVSARIDCNRGRGTWKSSGPNRLEFGPLALTRAMCPPGSLQDRIAKDWASVRSYTIKGGHLFLSLMAEGGTYEFESKLAVASIGPVEYECTQAGGGGDTLKATFYETKPGLVLVERGNQTRPAFQVLSANGAKYEGQELLFWDAHGGAQVKWSGVELTCKPR